MRYFLPLVSFPSSRVNKFATRAYFFPNFYCRVASNRMLSALRVGLGVLSRLGISLTYSSLRVRSPLEAL